MQPKQSKTNIWHFQNKLSHRLLFWSALSMVAGLLLQKPKERFLRALGQQFFTWGLIDGMIALIGKLSANRRATQLKNPLAQSVTEQEREKLHKLLWINAVLDIGYAAGGIILSITKGKKESSWRGHGFGVMIQAIFLFIFDIFHALKINQRQTT
jgi:hypothetical protein